MRTPSPIRVAFRSLIAGSVEFQNFGKGTDPKSIFRNLVDDAKHESGHGGYSGTIAEKYDFELRSRTPMSRQQARDFIEKDMDQSDKHGPAFAVPIAESKVKSEKEVTLKIPALSGWNAEESFKKQLSEKFPGAEVSVSGNSATKLKDGGLPDIEIVPDSKKIYTFGGWAHAGEYSTKKEALLALKKRLTDEPNSHVVQTWKSIPIMEIKTLANVVIKAPTSKLPVWEVKGKVRVVEVGGIQGYMFYGWASS